MPRNPEFKKEEVLDAAMRVFWTNGYRATSMIDIEQATNLKPGSIYNAFASKKGLFLEVIDHYREHIVGERIENILNQGSPLYGIEAFFRTTYEGFESDELIGCLLTNGATELSDEDKEIQKRITDGIAKIECAFRIRLEEAQQAGDLDEEKDVGKTALHLTSCYQGLCVIGRLTRNSQRLEIIADQALASLK